MTGKVKLKNTLLNRSAFVNRRSETLDDENAVGKKRCAGYKKQSFFIHSRDTGVNQYA